jgi:hypothetical protein
VVGAVWVRHNHNQHGRYFWESAPAAEAAVKPET